MVTTQPYCPGSSLNTLHNHLPCNSDPVAFATVDEQLQGTNFHHVSIEMGKPPTGNCLHFRQENCANLFYLAEENLFQAVYHSIRRDLGIHSPNQIWASPAMFNRTIQALPGSFLSEYSSTACFRANTSSSSQPGTGTWIPWDMEHDTVARTPQIFYLHWTYRLKSLGSAITSVFVATFTMLAAIWKIFTFIAGLVISKEDSTSQTQLEERVGELADQVGKLQEEMQRTTRHRELEYRLSLADEDSTLTEALLSSVNQAWKEKGWNGSQDGYERV
ncbi:hypothetical protein BDZ89DRAFT_1076902 [Hymenopellis radicata]|nr:hypothetical protein BDZ89DRAFT_1076902 [Hymenopellis radicata]